MIFLLGSSFLAIVVHSLFTTITVVSPVNGTTYSYYPIINITLDGNATACTYRLNASSTYTALGNGTYPLNLSWINSSAFTTSETGYNAWHNITFNCTNSTGSQINTTTAAGYKYFKIDTTTPIASFLTGAATNFTSINTSTWNFTFNFTDNNYYTCGLRYYQDTSMVSYDTFYGNIIDQTSGTDSKANCTLLFDPAYVSASRIANGQFVIQGFGNDTVNYVGVSSTNFTGVAVKIYGSKYNMFTYRGANATVTSETVSDFIKNHFSYASIISKWNNTYGNYTTYSSSTPTINSGTLLSVGDAIYIYSTTDKWYIQPDYTPAVGNAAENITLTLNGTTKNTTSWNQMGLFYNITMNSTLYACTYNGTAKGQTPGTCLSTVPSTYNITYISWFNASGNSYVTCKRGFSICSGGTNPANIILPEGQAVWVLPTGNIVLNRSAIV